MSKICIWDKPYEATGLLEKTWLCLSHASVQSRFSPVLCQKCRYKLCSIGEKRALGVTHQCQPCDPEQVPSLLMSLYFLNLWVCVPGTWY